MPSPFSLPVIGFSLLGAAAFGVHLGESAVSLIKPIYFQAPPVHPRDRGAAIHESELGRSGPAYADLYGWEEGHAARAADCGDCEALQARDAYAYSARVPYFGDGSRLHRAVADARDELGETFDDVPEFAPRTGEVERYAYYPVEHVETKSEPADVALAEDDKAADRF